MPSSQFSSVSARRAETRRKQEGALGKMEATRVRRLIPRLPGRDIAMLLDLETTSRILNIWLPEANADGALWLVQQSGMELEHGCRLVDALCQGLADRMGNVTKQDR